MWQIALHRSIFSMFLTEKLNREQQGNRFRATSNAASLRPETVTILQRDYYDIIPGTRDLTPLLLTWFNFNPSMDT